VNLSVDALSFSYGKIQAVRDVSFEVAAGEVYGLLGPNGAGKTTLINMIASLLTPQSGRISFCGRDVTGQPALIRPGLGVVPQEISLYDELSGRENLAFFGTLYGMQGSALASKVSETLELVGLSSEADRMLGGYSGGMKRRINIAASLLHGPRLILMDEPTVGVDPQSRNYIYDLIRRLSDEGISIIYTTHYMEEAQRLCRRVGIVDHGQLIAEGSIDELLEMLPQRDSILLKFDETASEELERLCSTVLSEYSVQCSGPELLFSVVNAGRSLASITAALGSAAGRISDLRVERANLESVFLHLTGRSLREG
jgi:ABC-2 type transport system ATP-binding protein